MNIPEKDRRILQSLGVQGDEFSLFDGVNLTYESDPEKGIRLYDPYYRTSCTLYIAVDGWTSWSGEDDRFMEQLFPEGLPSRPSDEETRLSPAQVEELKKKYQDKTNT